MDLHRLFALIAAAALVVVALSTVLAVRPADTTDLAGKLCAAVWVDDDRVEACIPVP